MNKERLIHLAQWLENGAKHETVTFDMTRGLVINLDDYVPGEAACATSCCLAGAAVQFFGNVAEVVEGVSIADLTWNDGEVNWDRVDDEAVDLLGLEYRKAKYLFEPQNYNGGGLADFDDPAWAARTIHHLVETGEVDWMATKEAA